MPSTAAEPAVRVVVGIISLGPEVLIAQRPGPSHQGGKWEFPGGKLKGDETAQQALRRELAEELGIQVRSAVPLIQVQHSYADRRVLLDVWRVIDFDGTPEGKEGQRIAWVRRDELRRIDFLAANQPIVRAVHLPSLYLVSDSRKFGRAGFMERLGRALEAGADLLQLREPDMAGPEYKAFAREVVNLCHRHKARVLLNADPAWVAECGADGVHLNAQRLQQLDSRPLGPEVWVAASTHDAEEIALASRLRVDFVVLSPVLMTRSHAQARPLGWQAFRDLTARTNLPVYALGGMRLEHMRQARDAGAQGLAMMSGIWEANHVEDVVTALL